jgi:hypothetical protein
MLDAYGDLDQPDTPEPHRHSFTIFTYEQWVSGLLGRKQISNLLLPPFCVDTRGPATGVL